MPKPFIMNTRFYWLVIICLLSTLQLHAQTNITNINETRVILSQPNILINDYAMPLELAKKLVVKGEVRGESNQILQGVTIKLVSIAKNKVERLLAYNSKKGTFQGEISHTGTYLVLIQKKDYTFYSEYIRVEDKTYTKARVIEVILKKQQK